MLFFGKTHVVCVEKKKRSKVIKLSKSLEGGRGRRRVNFFIGRGEGGLGEGGGSCKKWRRISTQMRPGKKREGEKLFKGIGRQ